MRRARARAFRVSMPSWCDASGDTPFCQQIVGLMGAARRHRPCYEITYSARMALRFSPDLERERWCCEDCGARIAALGMGRTPKYCSSRCRQRAYRKRNAAPSRVSLIDPYWSSPSAALYLGAADAVLTALPAGSVHCVMTSPPYWNLRDFGHPDQLGQERTPEMYVESLRATMREVARVLRSDGTVWLNLGDTYSRHSDGGPTGDRHAGRGHRAGAVTQRAINSTGTARKKSLLMIPARVALALQQDGWIIRNDIAWHKPNALPESVADRFATRHEHLFLLTRQPRYYFDLDAVREPQKTLGTRHAGSGGYRNAHPSKGGITRRELHPLGGNPGDVWTISNRPSNDAHFAMFPIDIPRRCIVAGSPPGGLVLDPFSGTGTTGAAALEHGRRYIGIDINRNYHDLAIRKLTNQPLHSNGDRDPSTPRTTRDS